MPFLILTIISMILRDNDIMTIGIMSKWLSTFLYTCTFSVAIRNCQKPDADNLAESLDDFIAD